MNDFLMTEDIVLPKSYDIADVRSGFRYWYMKLLDRCIDIFRGKGFNEAMPYREVLLNLFITGHSVLFPYNDEHITCYSALAGVDNYFQPTYAIPASPVYSKLPDIYFEDKYKPNSSAVKGVCIYNDRTQYGFFGTNQSRGLRDFIARYARQLADIESSINIYMVNTRLTSFPVATNSNVEGSLRRFFKNLIRGKRDIIVDEPIISAFRNIDLAGSTRDDLNSLLIARDKILECFYRDIGIRFYNPKKAQVTDDEVEANNQVLLIAVDEMLECQQEGFEKYNKLYGTHFEVEINPNYNPENFMKQEGGSKNEETDENKGHSDYNSDQADN